MAEKPPQKCPRCGKRKDALVGIQGKWACMDCIDAAVKSAVAPARRLRKMLERSDG